MGAINHIILGMHAIFGYTHTQAWQRGPNPWGPPQTGPDFDEKNLS